MAFQKPVTASQLVINQATDYGAYFDALAAEKFPNLDGWIFCRKASTQDIGDAIDVVKSCFNRLYKVAPGARAFVDFAYAANDILHDFYTYSKNPTALSEIIRYSDFVLGLFRSGAARDILGFNEGRFYIRRFQYLCGILESGLEDPGLGLNRHGLMSALNAASRCSEFVYDKFLDLVRESGKAYLGMRQFDEMELCATFIERSLGDLYSKKKDLWRADGPFNTSLTRPERERRQRIWKHTYEGLSLCSEYYEKCANYGKAIGCCDELLNRCWLKNFEGNWEAHNQTFAIILVRRAELHRLNSNVDLMEDDAKHALMILKWRPDYEGNEALIKKAEKLKFLDISDYEPEQDEDYGGDYTLDR